MLKIASSYRYEDYECNVLKDRATIDYQRLTNIGPVVTPENADPLLRFNATLPRMVCHNREECGIRRGDTNDPPAYAWELCPAHQTLGKTGSLPTIKRASRG